MPVSPEVFAKSKFILGLTPDSLPSTDSFVFDVVASITGISLVVAIIVEIYARQYRWVRRASLVCTNAAALLVTYGVRGGGTVFQAQDLWSLGLSVALLSTVFWLFAGGIVNQLSRRLKLKLLDEKFLTDEDPEVPVAKDHSGGNQ